jgi:hypothetical protein
MDKEMIKLLFENMALSMYAGEPCRICGHILTLEDVKAGAIWTGYSKDGKSRSAHKICWDNAMEIAREMYPSALGSEG